MRWNQDNFEFYFWLKKIYLNIQIFKYQKDIIISMRIWKLSYKIKNGLDILFVSFKLWYLVNNDFKLKYPCAWESVEPKNHEPL